MTKSLITVLFGSKTTKFCGMIIFLVVSLLVFSCEEVINPPIKAGKTAIVIDAWLTDSLDERLNFVKITQTIPYDAPIEIPLVSGAEVSIRYGTTSMPFQEVSAGYYLPTDRSFRAVAGLVYELNVVLQQIQYTAKASLPAKIQIDSLNFSFRSGIADNKAGYYATVFFQDQNMQSFYGWKSLVRDTALKQTPQIRLLNDKGFNGTSYNYLYPQPFALNDVVSITAYSFSAEAYQYYEALKELAENGTPAQSIPGNPKSNITGNSLGYFTVASITSVTDTVK